MSNIKNLVLKIIFTSSLKDFDIVIAVIKQLDCIGLKIPFRFILTKANLRKILYLLKALRTTDHWNSLRKNFV